MSMNGYNLSHNFFEWAFNHREEHKPIVSALYFYLVEVCNTLGWKKEFSMSAKECMEGMGVSGYNTYKYAFDVLCKNGFIKVIKKSTNQYQANIIALSNFNEATDRPIDEATDKAVSKQLQGTNQSTGDIHKTINSKTINSKTNKQKYADYVELTKEEFDKICTQYTEAGAKRMIEILNNYKGASGKKYKSDYMAILNWVVGRYNEELQKQSNLSSERLQRVGKAKEENYNNKDYSGNFSDFKPLSEKDYSERF